MITINFDLNTGVAKLAQTTVIKQGAEAPVHVVFSSAPGDVSSIKLALGKDTTDADKLLAYTEAFVQENDTAWTSTLDATDERLAAFMEGKGSTAVHLELAVTIDSVRQVAPNLSLVVQPPIIVGDPTSEGGPTYYTKAEVDSLIEAGDGETIKEDVRPLRVTKVENEIVAASGRINLLTVAPGTAGTVTMIQLALGASASAPAITQDSPIQVMADGVATPGQSVSVGAFFFIHGLNAGFQTDWVGTGGQATSNDVMDAFRFVEIPFTNGIVIDFVNLSGSAYARVFSQVTWRQGANPNLARRRKWFAHEIGYTASLAQYASVDLLPNVTGTGEIESVYLLVNSATNYSYLEGNPTWTIDGVAQTWGGTEDYFGGNYYFGNGAGAFVKNPWGAFFTLPSLSAKSAGLYRKHYPYARLNFSETAQLSWSNGQDGEADAPGAIGFLSCVTGWTMS